jgi:tetratricopeptide (TPR) repeat protein
MGRLQHWALRGDSAATPMWQAFLTETEAAEVFDAGKVPPRLEELHRESLFDILQFKHRAVRFVTGGLHDREAAATIAWALDGEGEPGITVGVITGAAGTGKSRLAAEVCDRLVDSSPEWQAGFADYTALAEARLPQRPTLLVCDYPERHPDRVGDFLARLWRHHREGRLPAPVRVLLVSRHRETWWEPLRARCRNLDDLIDHRIDLAPARLDADELDRHASQAFTDFCDGYGIPKVWRQDCDVRRAGADRPLLVHIAALLAAHELANSPAAARAESQQRERTGGNETLLDDLITAEIFRLLQLRVDDGCDAGAAVFTSPAQVREALCVTTLTAPSRCDLPDLLACTEAFGPNGIGNRAMVADALLDAFPATETSQPIDRTLRSVAPVEPDLIAAHLLAYSPGRSNLVKRLVESETVAEHPAYHAQMVSALALASEDYPIVENDLKKHLASFLSALIGAGNTTAASLTVLLADRLTTLVEAAVAAATDQQLSAARVLATALLLPGLDSDHGIDEAAAVAVRRLPYPHPALAALGVALTTRSRAYHERRRDLKGFAMACHGLGNWLSDNGQRTEGLRVTQQAVAIHRELTELDRAVFLPLLAGSVSNLAVRLAALGHRTEALEAAEEALEMRRELAEINRAVYLPELAGSTDNLAVRLAGLGRWSEALEYTEQAVAMRQELVEKNRSIHLRDLAMSMLNRGSLLAETDQLHEALATTQQAHEMFQDLADMNRAACLPDLAGSFQNLSIMLAESGRWDEAMRAAEMAVKLRRELVEGNRAAYLPSLALSMLNLGNLLADTGRRDEAVAAVWQTSECYQELIEESRAAYLPGLASSMSKLATLLGEAGRPEEALVAARQAHASFLELAEEGPAAYRQALASSMHNLAVRLAEASLRNEALTVAYQAFQGFRELVGEDRAPHLPALASSLNNLAKLLAEDDQLAEALRAARQARECYQELVHENRAAYLPDLASTMIRIAATSARIGLRTPALEAAASAVAICEELAENSRTEYLPELARSYWTSAHVRVVLKVEIIAAIPYCDQAEIIFRELNENDVGDFSDAVIAVEDLRAELSAIAASST